MPKTITTEIEYAYEMNSAIVPNLNIQETDSEGNQNTVYKIRLSIQYELKTIDNELVEVKNVEHYSEASATMRTAEEVTEWVAANRDGFIAADKKELAGYGE